MVRFGQASLIGAAPGTTAQEDAAKKQDRLRSRPGMTLSIAHVTPQGCFFAKCEVCRTVFRPPESLRLAAPVGYMPSARR